VAIQILNESIDFGSLKRVIRKQWISRQKSGLFPEKEGFTWVGHIGLKFGTDGRLVAVKPSIEVL
jgi:hypothetical protein